MPKEVQTTTDIPQTANKLPTKTTKQYKDTPFNDTSIQRVRQLVAINTPLKDIANMLGLKYKTISKINSYLRKADLTHSKKVSLASKAYEKALNSEDLAVALPIAHKVYEAVGKQLHPEQAAPQGNVQVNIFDPREYAVNDVAATESQNKTPSPANACPSIGREEIIDCRASEGVGGAKDE